MINDFDFDRKQSRIKNLSNIYSQQQGEKIKILSEEPYVEDLLKVYFGDTKEFNYLLPSEGDRVTGSVIGTTGKWMVLDAGYKDNIYIELKGQELEALKSLDLHKGDPVEVLITHVGEENFELRGSVVELRRENLAIELEDSIHNEEFAYLAHVKELKPAGYFVDIILDGVKCEAFMPNTLSGINKLPDPEELVGKDIYVMIENKTKDGFIASRKKFLQTQIEGALKNLEIGKEYTGIVTGTTDFGIFVEFEKCLTGMIHKANVKEEFQNGFQFLQPGTEINFFVKEIVKDKIILTQVMRESLWDTIEVGQKLEGTVKSRKQFGVLVILDEETMGLIHISELEKSNRNNIKAGDKIEVEITEIRRADRKIFLKIV